MGRSRGMFRFLIVLVACTILRFYLGTHSPNFLWFFVLYLPLINWGMYWVMCAVRLGINRMAGKEVVTEPGLKRFYVWYLRFPGALAAAELIYRGYVYNR